MSSTIRTIRLIAWAAVAIAIAGLAAVSLGVVPQTWLAGGTAPVSTVGGPFTLINTKGETVTDKTFLGKPTLFFFGFTHCPEACPTTLLEMTGYFKSLGADADKINAVFVTVDPARDTKESLAEYISAFDPRIVGLTGTQEQIDAIVAAFRVYVRKETPDPKTGDYNVDHTTATYVMDAQGRFVVPIQYREDETTALAKIRRALAG